MANRIDSRGAASVAQPVVDWNDSAGWRRNGKASFKTSILPDFQIMFRDGRFSGKEQNQEPGVKNATVLTQFGDVASNGGQQLGRVVRVAAQFREL